MKRFRHISIRARITLMTAAICAMIAVLVTVFSLNIANEQFDIISISVPIDELGTEVDDSIIVSQHNDTDPLFSDSAFAEMDSIIVRAQSNFQLKLYLALAFVLLLAVFSAWVLSGLMLKPVKQLEAAVRDISANTLETRLPPPAVQDEIGSLTDGFNQMLDRLSADFERQKQFSSAVAHELKTPLATLQASLQLAQMEGSIDPELCDVAQRSTSRLNELISGLLNLYQNTQETQRQSFSLHSVLQESAQELRAQYPDRRISLQLPAQEPPCSGNAVLLHRLFSNLLENACKYSRVGGEVQLNLRTEADGCTVSVIDHGIGIPAQALPHLYEPFYRVDPSRNRDSGGFGLGLSIVKAIADSEGYTLTIESSEAGSSVHVFLPQQTL